MNCKPGDLAFIRPPTETPHADDVTGLLVTVIVRARRHGNRLPDVSEAVQWSGYDPACPAWVVQSASPRADVLRDPRGSRAAPATKCFVIWDHRLRPIRPGDITDEEVHDLYAPKQTEAA